MGRRHRRSKVTRVVNLVKRIIAFFFSHVGLCALVIGYALLGAVVFRAVEGPHEEYIQKEVSSARNRAINVAWNATFRVNKLDQSQWEKTVYAQVKLFQRKCMWAIPSRIRREGARDIRPMDVHGLTVITTIGYGNTAAKTYFGKTLTILFAIIGIPLMLLFLTNIGDVMAKIFRFLYARSIRLKYKLILWHKKRRAAKIRRANSLVAKLARSSSNRQYLGAGWRSFGVRDDCSLESLGFPSANTSDIHELLAARAHLDQLEVKESVEAQLQRISVPLSLVLLTMLAYTWSPGRSSSACFGDKFPGASVGNDKEAQEKLVITSVYLLFGMALPWPCASIWLKKRS
ncbi:Potassium channel subfamily K member 18 [Aphelenchoides fujianensis]|nr:Potassium channel subfamily K member 18 [Aphelenchoides fujianensis]